MLRTKLIQLFTKQPKLGLLPIKKDDRDLGFGWIFGTSYVPKFDKKEIAPFTIKSQKYNTCTFASAVGMKEIDEKKKLSIRYLVIKAKQAGFISGDGFSNVRYAQKALNKYGTCEESLLAEEASSWQEYSNPQYITKQMEENAEKYKTDSYLFINSIDEVYKAIDEDRPVQIGIDWYTGYNLSGGFKLPWIIHKIIGYLIGGHAMYVYGYNKNYKTQFVCCIANSFGMNYGDNGRLYITSEMLSNYINKYGAAINYDVKADIAKWLSEHQNKNVLSGGKIYKIIQDKKYHYPDMATFISHNGNDNNFINVDTEILDQVKEGDKMDFFKGTHYIAANSVIKRIKDKVDDIEFKKYFPDLYAK